MPKHRKNVIVRTEPRVQPAPKHRAVVHPADHVGEFNIRDLMQATFIGNPYRPTGVGRHAR